MSSTSSAPNRRAHRDPQIVDLGHALSSSGEIVLGPGGARPVELEQEAPRHPRLEGPATCVRDPAGGT